jgi:hypothetical protein
MFAASAGTPPRRTQAGEREERPSKYARVSGVREVSSSSWSPSSSLRGAAIGGKENSRVGWTPSSSHDRSGQRNVSSFHNERRESASPEPPKDFQAAKKSVDLLLINKGRSQASSDAVALASRGPHAQPAPSKYDRERPKADAFWQFNALKQRQREQQRKLSQMWGSKGKSEVAVPGSTEGFRNLGNTCYMNAGLQALLGLTPFAVDLAAELARRDGTVDSTDRTMTAALLGVYDQLRTAGTRKGTMDASRVARAVSKIFAGRRQEDVHEFVGYCLDRLDEEATAAIKQQRALEKAADKDTAGPADVDDDVIEVTDSPAQGRLNAPPAALDGDAPMLINDSDDDDNDNDNDDDDRDPTTEEIEMINGLEAEAYAKTGWNPDTIANRNFGCEILQSRRCENALCPSVTNPIKV